MKKEQSTNISIPFEHNMSAHCENGVTRNLLNFYGVQLSEAMVFGIGSGIFFSYMPFLKLNGMPVVSFRPLPGVIFKRTAKRLGFEVKSHKFRFNQDAAMTAADKLLQKGIPVGMVVGVYHLYYFPKAYRFHFNAHNIVVFEKKDDIYKVSDPIMPGTEAISYDDLKRVRYAQGTFKPQGNMYYIQKKKTDIDLKQAIRTGIKHTCKDMLKIPIKFFGIKGIYVLAKQIRKWPAQIGEAKTKKYLGQIVRMQEEIGTGGAGFRFLYAAFLQEAAEIMKKPELAALSEQMTETGDKWREFAVMTGRIYKERITDKNAFETAAQLLEKIADREIKIFTKLSKVIS